MDNTLLTSGPETPGAGTNVGKATYICNSHSHGGWTTSLEEIVEAIRVGIFAKTVGDYQRIPITQYLRQRDFKADYMAAFCGGIFKGDYIHSKYLIASNYLVFDIDHVDDVASLKESLCKSALVKALFVSPSAKGLKLIIEPERPIGNVRDHKRVYDYVKRRLERRLKVPLDSTNDPARLCYFSYDPDIYYNPSAKKLPVDAILNAAPSIVSASSPEIETSRFSDDERWQLYEQATACLAAYRWDDYHSWMVLGLIAKDCDAVDLWISRSACSPKFPGEDACRRKLDSFHGSSTPVGLGTLAMWAEEDGGFDISEFYDLSKTPLYQSIHEGARKVSAALSEFRKAPTISLDAAVRNSWLGLSQWLIESKFQGKVLFNHTTKCFDLWNADSSIWEPDQKNYICGNLRSWLLGPMERHFLELMNLVKQQQAAYSIANKGANMAKDSSPEWILAEQFKKLMASLKGPDGIDTLKRQLSQMGEISVLEDEYDSDIYKVNLKNGLFDLKTGTLLLPEPKRRLCKKRFNADYDPNAVCPAWIGGMNSTLDGNADKIGWLQRFFGTCLSGEVTEVSALLYGGGCNGKSIIVKIVSELMGSYATPLDMSILMKDKRSFGGNPEYELIRMKGLRLGFAAESEKECKLNEAVLKKLNSIDSIRGRNPAEKAVVFTPTHKCLMMTNNKPEIAAGDSGTWRRLALVLFRHNYKNDPNRESPAKLLAAYRAEANGILNWLLAGWFAYQEHGVELPDSIRGDTEQFKAAENPLFAFINEQYAFDNSSCVPLCDIWGCWNKFSEAEGISQHPDSKSLSKALRDDFGLTVERHGRDRKAHVFGLKSKPSETQGQ